VKFGGRIWDLNKTYKALPNDHTQGLQRLKTSQKMVKPKPPKCGISSTSVFLEKLKPC
jgi:hypothetical protein